MLAIIVKNGKKKLGGGLLTDVNNYCEKPEKLGFYSV